MDRYLALTEIVKAYIEGKTSAREVNAALIARNHLNIMFVKSAPQGGVADQIKVLDFVKKTLAVEMCEIVQISEERFGTKQGMRNILADPYLIGCFSQAEQIEIQKIAYATFFAHKKLVAFMQLIHATYAN